jgi:segregation and condensation protein B
MNEELEKKIPELEALLFHYGDPISLKRVASMLKIKEKECEELILSFQSKLQNDQFRGLMITKIGDEVQLVTKPEYQWIGGKIVEEEFKEQLTPAALETLSLIAYLGPVSRPTIDYIRGVNSSFIVRNLLMRGLVTRHQGEERKNMFEYSVTFDFLKHMGIGSVSELPEYEKYKKIFDEYESQEFQAPLGETQSPVDEQIKSGNEIAPSEEHNENPLQ